MHLTKQEIALFVIAAGVVLYLAFGGNWIG